MESDGSSHVRRYALGLMARCLTSQVSKLLHGYDLAVRAELHIESVPSRAIKHRIPLDLEGQILMGFAPSRGGRGRYIPRPLHPVSKKPPMEFIILAKAARRKAEGARLRPASKDFP